MYFQIISIQKLIKYLNSNRFYIQLKISRRIILYHVKKNIVTQLNTEFHKYIIDIKTTINNECFLIRIT